MPQVQVALRRKARGEDVKAGAFMSYIITRHKDEEDSANAISDQHAAERAYPVQDVLKKDSNLKPDPEWYLIKQIYPPIERLCAPIDGTDSIRLAECLGLDTRKYQIVGANNSSERELVPYESKMTDEERFKDCEKLSLKCRFCKEAFEFQGLIGSTSCCTPQGIVCPNSTCGKLLSIPSIVAQVEHQLRQAIQRYYDAWLVCNECGIRTKQMSVYGKRRCVTASGTATGCKGHVYYEYTDKMVYNQLLYFKSVFDVQKARNAADKKAEKGSYLSVSM